ncbi:MAG: uracil-DNA glycosylase [Sporomusaceae bacterium]|nr:uracil-DNA glycosylase [Sporomusaceae bacterium]
MLKLWQVATVENYATIEELEAGLLTCRSCDLCNTTNRGPTSYTGTAKSPLMIIGEGPGGVEDEYGVPLVGPSGQLLDKALWSVGVTRDRVYTTNVVKCRPQGNRTPTIEEGCFCADLWLAKEIALVKPQAIVALGSVALRYLYGADKKITKERGKWFQTEAGIWAIPTFHPAYLLRLSGKPLVTAKWNVFYDLKAAIEKCREAPEYTSYMFASENTAKLLELYEQRRNERSERKLAVK